ncbi:MAG: DUF1572 domain-containing protein [Flavobacteriales bacterium]|nr:DUF1572 domain-containing protein [Flavobacteriales bacterium]
MKAEYIKNIRAIFQQYKTLGEKAMAQVEEKRLFWTFNNESNSIAMIVQHISGNMLSRFTNFYEEDGEKPWRNRDREFENIVTTRAEMMDAWEKGWKCFLDVVNNLQDLDLERTVYIRNEPHSVLEAVNRQLAHYSYHVGQIVFLSKMVADAEWNSLSIPKNKSREFNDQMFSKPKS